MKYCRATQRVPGFVYYFYRAQPSRILAYGEFLTNVVESAAALTVARSTVRVVEELVERGVALVAMTFLKALSRLRSRPRNRYYERL